MEQEDASRLHDPLHLSEQALGFRQMFDHHVRRDQVERFPGEGHVGDVGYRQAKWSHAS